MTNARTLINSHLFCVDHLSDADMHEHLSRDGPPVQYDGQHLFGYHWFAYPNAAEGLYSTEFLNLKPIMPIEQLGIRPAEFTLKLNKEVYNIEIDIPSSLDPVYVETCVSRFSIRSRERVIARSCLR